MSESIKKTGSEPKASQADVKRSGPNSAEDMMQTEDSYKLLVESVQDYAIFMLDANGIVSSWNLGAERIKGYQPKQIIGKHMSTFYMAEDVEKGKPLKLLTIAREQGRVEDEGWRVRRNGTKFWANVVITALYDESGQLRGYGKVTRDLTERKSALKIQTAYEELEGIMQEMNSLNAELRESNVRLVGREYRIRELENEVRLLRMRLELSLPW